MKDWCYPTLPCRCGSTAVPTAQYGYWDDGLSWYTEWIDWRCKNGHVFTEYIGDHLTFHLDEQLIHRRRTDKKTADRRYIMENGHLKMARAITGGSIDTLRDATEEHLGTRNLDEADRRSSVIWPYEDENGMPP